MDGSERRGWRDLLHLETILVEQRGAERQGAVEHWLVQVVVDANLQKRADDT